MGSTVVKRVLRSVPLAALAIVACVQPRQGSPQIEVSPGLARRAALMPGRRAGAVDDAPAKTAPARARPMTRADALGGPNATGGDGDWLLDNGEVVFVVSGLGHSAGFAESGGNVVDAADARVRKDELGLFFTYFGDFPRQAVYDRIEGRVSETSGVAVVEAHGVELYERALSVTTTYELAPGDRALLVRTTLTNGSDAEITLPGLGDALQWGGAEKVAPGQPVGFRGRSSGPYLGGIGRHVSYGLTSIDGDIEAISGGSWSDTEQAKATRIAPGASVTYARVLVVGARPDLASIVAELSHASGGALGTVRFDLVDGRGAPVDALPGAKILLLTPAGAPVLSVVRGETGGPFEAELPPGRYVATYAPSVGRSPLAGGVPVIAAQGARTKARLAVSDASEMVVGPCTEDAKPVPCKLTIEGRGATTKAPELGAMHLADGARNQLILGPGETRRLPMAAGQYRITASRGPEYDLTIHDVDVPQSEPATFALQRVVRTPGYVATDFHQHTIWSADAPVGVRDRLRANAAEGVEVAVASEHNVVADLAREVKAQGLGAFLVEVPGDEVTTDSSRKPWGHVNAYPLPFVPGAARGGAPAVRERPFDDVVRELRARPGDRVVQVNHPRSGKNGVFDQLGFDVKTGRAADPTFTDDFDALEVWNGRNVDARTRVIEDWFALLRRGKVTTPIADTDTHGIVGEEAGYPRTWVRVQSDEALDGWDEARTRDLVTSVKTRRDVVLSNGPFVEVEARVGTRPPVGIGGLLRARRGEKVTVKVTAHSASWIALDAIELRFVSDGRTVPLQTGGWRGGGANVERAEETFSVKADDAFVVVVRGNAPMRPVLEGDDASIRPFAMTGPIFVDGDGDGRALGAR